MNKIFKTKYNYLTKNSVVTSELVKNRGKSGLVKKALAVAMLSVSYSTMAYDETYHNEFRGDLHKNADGSLTYSGSGGGWSSYYFNKLNITGSAPNTASLGLNLDSIGYGFDEHFGLGLLGKADGYRLDWDSHLNKRVKMRIATGDEIKAEGENGVAIKVLDEFKKDKHTQEFLVLSNEDKVNKIKELYKNFYVSIEITNFGDISSEQGDAIDFSAFNRKDLFGKVIKDLNLNVSTEVYTSGSISAPEDKAAFIGSDYKGFLYLDDRGMSRRIQGNIYLGKGDDELTILRNNDLSRIKVLEGSYKNNPDPLDIAENNTLYIGSELTGSGESLGSYEDKAIRNFGKIIIGDILNITGNMISNSGKVGDIYNFTQLNITPKNNHSNIRLDYNVHNLWKIDLSKNDLPHDTLTISGNYDDYKYDYDSGGHIIPDIRSANQLLLNTFWQNPDIQQTDKLIIEGNHEGTTTVKAYYQGNESIFGDVTRSDVEKNGGLLTPVVEIKGEEKGKFEGTAPTTNAGEAQLVRHGNKYYWTLTALEQPAPQPEPVQPSPQPEPVQPAPQPEPVQPAPQPEPVQPAPQPEPVQPAPQPEPVQPAPQPAVPANNGPMIYAEQIAGYVQTQRIAREALLQENGKLQTRMGSLQAPLTPQTWARVGGGYTQEQGKDRLAYKSKAKFVQIGSDLFVNSNENGVRRGGLMASFNRADNKFYDKYHAQNGYIVADKLVGKGKLETATLGLYSTWYGNNGLYLDTTANVGWIGAKYTAQNGNKAKNHGFSFMANTEVGKKIAISTDGRWNFVPQAQLTLLKTKMGGFNDGIRDMKSSHQTVLRGRVGAGVSFNAEKGKNANSFFASLNLVHDFMGAKTELEVGRDRITERYAPTFGEVSIGGVLPLGKQLSAQANLNYTRALSKTNTLFSGSGKEAYQGYVGLKYIW